MSKFEKLIDRFLEKPTDFTWQELIRLLTGLGYKEAGSGKTGGSRTRFIHNEYPTIILHKPHPKPILKRYQIYDIIDLLRHEGIL